MLLRVIAKNIVDVFLRHSVCKLNSYHLLMRLKIDLLVPYYKIHKRPLLLLRIFAF